MDTNHTKGIIEGFEEDFPNIVDKFSKTCPELGISNFMKFWSNELDCIFANRFDPRELLEAIQALNDYLIDLITNKDVEHHTKTIALYFILCMYVKQPERLRRKIRVDHVGIMSLNRLSSSATCQNLASDIKFVWKMLRRLKAIDFVEERCIYGPSMLRGARKNSQRTESQRVDDDTTEFIDTKLEPELMEILNLSTPYAEMKSSLQLDNVIDAPRSENIKSLLDQANALLFQFKS